MSEHFRTSREKLASREKEHQIHIPDFLFDAIITNHDPVESGDIIRFDTKLVTCFSPPIEPVTLSVDGLLNQSTSVQLTYGRLLSDTFFSGPQLIAIYLINDIDRSHLAGIEVLLRTSLEAGASPTFEFIHEEVDDRYRHKGLTTKVLQYIEQYMLQLGQRIQQDVSLVSHESKPNVIHWLTKNGYVPTAESEAVYREYQQLQENFKTVFVTDPRDDLQKQWLYRVEENTPLYKNKVVITLAKTFPI